MHKNSTRMVKILKAFLGKSEGSESFKKQKPDNHSSSLSLKKGLFFFKQSTLYKM